MDHPFGADQFYGNFNSWEDTKTWFAGVQQAFGAKTTASFSFRRHSDLFVLYRDRPDVFANHHSDESYQLAVRRREEMSTSTTLYYGVEGLHESIASNNLGDHARTRAAAYAAADFRALKRFSLTISAREELYRSFSAAFTPTVAGGVWLSPQWKLRASTSRAFRIPSYTDLYYHDPGNVGNPNLRPESAWTYETGVDWVPSARIRGDLTLFERRETRRHRLLPHLRHRYLARAQHPEPEFQRLGSVAALDPVPHPHRRFPLHPTARHAGHHRRGLHQVHLQLPHRQRRLRLDRSRRAAISYCAPGSARSNAWSVRPYALWDIYLALPRHKVHPYLQVSNATNTSYQSDPRRRDARPHHCRRRRTGNSKALNRTDSPATRTAAGAHSRIRCDLRGRRTDRIERSLRLRYGSRLN